MDTLQSSEDFLRSSWPSAVLTAVLTAGVLFCALALFCTPLLPLCFWLIVTIRLPYSILFPIIHSFIH
jgi:hypothetical protein